VCLWFHQIFLKKIIRVTNCPDCIPLISFNTVLKWTVLHHPFHLYSYFILIYTFISTFHIHIPIQSIITEKNKKFFTVGFWIGLARLWIIFLVLDPGKKRKEIPEPVWTRPDPCYPRLNGLTIHYVGCGSRFSNSFTVGRVVRNMLIRPAPTPTNTPNRL
jgi:hypothetical protein